MSFKRYHKEVNKAVGALGIVFGFAVSGVVASVVGPKVDWEGLFSPTVTAGRLCVHEGEHPHIIDEETGENVGIPPDHISYKPGDDYCTVFLGEFFRVRTDDHRYAHAVRSGPSPGRN